MHWEKIKEHTRVVKMDKKLLKVVLVVLNAVKSRFTDTKGFVDDTLKEECEKEKKTADEVIFLLLNLQKKISLDKHFCFRFGTKVIIFLFIDVEKCGR